jgi:hypothetical protein
MAIIGNIFLSIATLIYAIIVSTIFGKAPPRGGDAATGYPMSIILFNLVFLGCMIIAAIAIAWKGGFDWISPNKSSRYLLVAAGLVSAVITAGLSALFKYEPGSVPALLRFFSGFAPAIIPLVLIATGFVLLNPGIREAVPLAAYKWPLVGVFALGILGVAAGLFTWISVANENAKRKIEGIISDQARYHQGYLNEIDTCDITKNMAHILVFTDANHDADVRAAAVAKVKTNPKWQAELIYLLENKGASEALNFLASNEVEDKSLFVEPVNTGVLSIADWIRRSLREATSYNTFYADSFSWEVERSLRTIAKFEGMGKDYRPAVRALRAAFDEPSATDKVAFDGIPLLDNWIKKHP